MARSSEPVPDLSGLRIADIPTPIGVLRLGYVGKKVSFLDLKERGMARAAPASAGPVERPPFPDGSPPEQVREYFQGGRKDFHVELAFLGGSEFDRKVWYGLHQIPYGSLRTYGELARALGKGPGAARAVGGAAGRNPIPIIVPCHRLVGQDRSLTGFGMGLWRKRWLLEHEGTYPLPERRDLPKARGRQATLEESLRSRARSRRPTPA